MKSIRDILLAHGYYWQGSKKSLEFLLFNDLLNYFFPIGLGGLKPGIPTKCYWYSAVNDGIAEVEVEVRLQDIETDVRCTICRWSLDKDDDQLRTRNQYKFTQLKRRLVSRFGFDVVEID